MKTERQLIEKQKKLILIFKKYFKVTLPSDKDWGELKALESEIAALEAKLEQETITDADIEAWAEKRYHNWYISEKGHWSELLGIGAKAVLNDEIKHIK